eukprot:TRINITY_DN10801_c0_g2_i2.p1 TRINITY_DN10801_c0_g2~~TRINITY_DN10801_c0_g2_i2.p1  ORF type:complete len:323 (+),score=41.30 TRINITY_DN10801_c0_g2_i2:523-1491(+)
MLPVAQQSSSMNAKQLKASQEFAAIDALINGPSACERQLEQDDTNAQPQQRLKSAIKTARTCPKCADGVFMRVDHLRHHLLGHLGVKPYVCLECQRSYRQVYSLRRHQRSAGHHGQRKLHVDVGPLFSTQSDSGRAAESPSSTSAVLMTPSNCNSPLVGRLTAVSSQIQVTAPAPLGGWIQSSAMSALSSATPMQNMLSAAQFSIPGATPMPSHMMTAAGRSQPLMANVAPLQQFRQSHQQMIMAAAIFNLALQQQQLLGWLQSAPAARSIPASPLTSSAWLFAPNRQILSAAHGPNANSSAQMFGASAAVTSQQKSNDAAS